MELRTLKISTKKLDSIEDQIDSKSDCFIRSDMCELNGFDSIKQMETYALNHYCYSTCFDHLFRGQIDKKRRLTITLIVIFSWFLALEQFLWMIPGINDFVSLFTANYTYVVRDDRDSILVMSICYMSTIFCLQTDYFINEKHQHYLRDINMLKNGKTNKLNKSNLRKIQIQSELFYKVTIKLLIPFMKIIVSLFAVCYHSYGYLKYNKYNYPLSYNIIHCIIWILTINHCADVVVIYPVFSYLSIYYLKLRFNQINEKLIKMSKRKLFKPKQLIKILLEHKSIEKKTELYNESFNRCAAVVLIGFTMGFIANLQIITFSKYQLNQLYSFSLGSSLLLLEIFISNEMVSLNRSAHKSYTIINSLFVTRKMHLKTKFKVNYSIKYSFNTFSF